MGEYLSEFGKNDPISISVIKEFEKQSRRILPSDYSDFMLASNGGEGTVGVSYLILWKIEEVIELNEAYGVDDYAPGLLIIGSDGGDTAYCIDYRKEVLKYIKIPFIGMSLDMVEKCGVSFNDFLKHIYELQQS